MTSYAAPTSQREIDDGRQWSRDRHTQKRRESEKAMSNYDNTNRGTIGKNTRKTEDTHPDIAGQINVDGKDYWLNGWQKKNNNDGTTFYSLSVKPKEARQDAPSGAPAPGFSGGVETDDIPFAPEWR